MAKDKVNLTKGGLMINRGEEDYIKALYKLDSSNDKNAYVKTQALVDHFKHSRPSVNEMIKKLSQSHYVKYKPYVGVKLTHKGNEEAIKMIRKHRLWELFLNKYLGLSKEQVHDEAEKLEHATSELVLEALNNFLASPDTCPHGKKIPK
jgi:DtxR family Mn-dependent transcriptional regulator